MINLIIILLILGLDHNIVIISCNKEHVAGIYKKKSNLFDAVDINCEKLLI